jgi:heptosyltransferase-2
MAQLVVQTAFPGDLLLSIPLLKQVRRYYPNEKIVLLCRLGLGELFLREKLADEVWEVNKKDKSSMKKVLSQLRAEEWTRIFCPHESYRTAFWVRSLKVKEFSVGFKKWWNFWAFSKRIDRPMRLPDAMRQLSLLLVNPQFKATWDREVHEIRIGNPSTHKDTLLTRAIPDWARMTLHRHEGSENKIFIAPGSVWPTKMWSREGFRDLAKSLKSKGFEVVFVGAPSEQALCESIAQEAGVSSIAGQTTVYELTKKFLMAKALISNDSGAMHAASVAGLPTVAVFGPTVLEFGFRPWNEKSAVAQLDLNCRPCAAHGGKKCPLGTHACMRDLPYQQVERLLFQLIGN